MSRYNKNFGDFGESAAAEYLTKIGYKILSQKYYTPFGEIDIVALSPCGSTLVFIEVKTRKDKKFGMAAQSIDKTKIRRIVKSAQVYVSENPADFDCRFDVIEVYGSAANGVSEINHIENAFFDVSEYF